MRTLHLSVEGLVQAVGFRYYTLTQAQSIGINGWVKNTRDGRVEIIAQGEERRINTFVEHIKKGPRFSRVDQVHIEEITNAPTYRSFDITY